MLCVVHISLSLLLITLVTNFLIHSIKIIDLICINKKFQSVSLEIEYRFVTFHVVSTILDLKHIYVNFLSITCIQFSAFLMNLYPISEFSEDDLFFADLRTSLHFFSLSILAMSSNHLLSTVCNSSYI